ncbi:MAG: hypothetical protein R3E65_02125 [Steroidobacteraceae bacterium]
MIVARHCAFLHLHKCGGSFVNELLLRELPGARMLGYHLPRSRLPPDASALPVLGIVRSPWSYYVSWFAFQSARPRPNPLFQIASDHGRRDFAATVDCLLHLGEREREFDALRAALPPDYVGRGLNLPAPAIEPLRGGTQGFFSFLFDYMFGPGAGSARIGRLERLGEALPALLQDAGEAVTDRLREQLQHAAPRNRSAHAHYTRYYDDALRQRVAQRDAVLIERFGYRFGD